ncbi:threonine aldolase family protein [Kitasatospora sp. NPDC056181]|uniref:threonine aldolase family protein n=1 Tax=Kitasatospora sp. NPDC056181 TaxID=3345737 RepID=UPI0035D98D96
MYPNRSESTEGGHGPGLQERRFAARRGCERLLSGTRPRTLREHLAALAEDAEGVYDLDRRPDMYGDGVVGDLEQKVAGLLGTEDAAFFPTGTMAQQVALRIHAEAARLPTVATHPLGHTEQHERHALTVLGGLRSVWPTVAPRLPTVAELEAFDEPYAAMIVELPLREAGFVLPTWAELEAVAAVVREGHGAALHLDGARIWESAVHFGRSLPEITATADSVYVSFYKTLGGISGAALAGGSAFVRTARAWRHRYGGQLFQQWPAALAALAGLERELPRLAGYVTHAKTVAAALAEAFAVVPGARVHPAPPHTHQFQLWLPYTPEELDTAGLRLAEEAGTALFGAWRERELPGLSMTEVTVAADALDWTEKEIAEAVDAFLALLPRQSL